MTALLMIIEGVVIIGIMAIFKHDTITTLTHEKDYAVKAAQFWRENAYTIDPQKASMLESGLYSNIGKPCYDKINHLCHCEDCHKANCKFGKE